MGFIMDCERYRTANAISGKVADCLFVDGGAALTLATVELKGGRLHADTAIEQIQNTLLMADHLFSEWKVGISLPVLLHRKGLHPEEIKVLRKKKVEFRGLRRLVVIERCGIAFRDLLESYASHYEVP